MDSVLRAAAIYGFLLVLFRAMGKRTLAQITTFDFVMLLIIGEATQQGLLGDDFSVVNGLLVVATLVGVDIGISMAKARSQTFTTLTEGSALIVVENGKPIEERMKKSRVDVDDIMEAARTLQGLERIEQIKYAVVERSGGISVVPYRWPPVSRRGGTSTSTSHDTGAEPSRRRARTSTRSAGTRAATPSVLPGQT